MNPIIPNLLENKKYMSDLNDVLYKAKWNRIDLPSELFRFQNYIPIIDTINLSNSIQPLITMERNSWRKNLQINYLNYHLVRLFKQASL